MIKLTGLFLLVSGWIIVLAAVACLPAGALQACFALAGVAVEIAGLVLVFRDYIGAHRSER